MAAEGTERGAYSLRTQSPHLTLSDTIEKPGTKRLNQKVESATEGFRRNNDGEETDGR
jgi:hypothetical protein